MPPPVLPREWFLFSLPRSPAHVPAGSPPVEAGILRDLRVPTCSRSKVPRAGRPGRTEAVNGSSRSGYRAGGVFFGKFVFCCGATAWFRPASEAKLIRSTMMPFHRPPRFLVQLRSHSVLILVTGLSLGTGLALSGCNRAGGGKQAGRVSAPVPVVAGVVQQRDTPHYLDGIGTVAAFNNVTVHAQIDGQLRSVAYQEGQEVKAGDLLAEIDPRVLQAQWEAARAKKVQDEAQLANARSAYERNNQLWLKGLVDQQTAESYHANFDQMAALVQADAAAVTSAEVQLGYTRIVAPISGRTGLRQVDVGNIVHPTDANGLVVITQLKPISVIFSLPQQALARIQEATRTNPALPILAVDRDSRTPLDQGVLAVVDNQIDSTTGTVRLKATFPNDQLALWPGQFVNIRLLVSTRKNGLVVPSSVVQRGPQGAYAFVIQPDPNMPSNLTVVQRSVEVGQIDGGLALIDSGLQAGERVVVDGQYKLQAGSTVAIAAEGSGNGAPAGQPDAAKRRASKP